MRPARSSTLRCLEIVGWLSANGFMISDTSASPDARRARIARRVGSASAEKVNPRGSNCPCISMWLYCHIAIDVSREEGSSEPWLQFAVVHQDHSPTFPSRHTVEMQRSGTDRYCSICHNGSSSTFELIRNTNDSSMSIPSR